MDNGQHRYQNLEGLRGLAALIVVIGHFAIAFLPFLIGFVTVAKYAKLDDLTSNTPLFLVFDGSFSVAVFFVLSGFVLSLSFFRKKDKNVLVAAASRRYFRLMLPALGSVIMSYIIMRIGYHAHMVTATITGSQWLTWFWTFPPHLWDALRQGSFGAFFNQQTTYNDNLWTMSVELTGSFLVFGLLAFFGQLHKRWVVYLAFAVIFIHSWYLAFLLGVIISDIWVNYPELKEKIRSKYAVVMLVVALALGSWHYNYNHIAAPYFLIRLPFFSLIGTEQFMRTIAAAFLIVSVLRLQWLSRFFELRPLQYLGRISFSLYLIHFAVILSFSCLLFNRLYPHLGYVDSFAVMFVSSMVIIFVIAHYYTKFVDAPSIAFSKSVGSWLMSPWRVHPVNQRSKGPTYLANTAKEQVANE